MIVQAKVNRLGISVPVFVAISDLPELVRQYGEVGLYPNTESVFMAAYELLCHYKLWPLPEKPLKTPSQKWWRTHVEVPPKYRRRNRLRHTIEYEVCPDVSPLEGEEGEVSMEQEQYRGKYCVHCGELVSMWSEDCFSPQGVHGLSAVWGVCSGCGNGNWAHWSGAHGIGKWFIPEVMYKPYAEEGDVHCPMCGYAEIVLGPPMWASTEGGLYLKSSGKKRYSSSTAWRVKKSTCRVCDFLGWWAEEENVWYSSTDTFRVRYID